MSTRVKICTGLGLHMAGMIYLQTIPKDVNTPLVLSVISKQLQKLPTCIIKTTTADAQLYLRAGIDVVNKFHHSLLSLHWAYSCVCCNVLQNNKQIITLCPKYFCNFLFSMVSLKKDMLQYVLEITLVGHQ